MLHNITDYLIEEASAEEEELLGLEPSSETQDVATTVERDENLIRVLDKIILYLRIVHSVDYYNHCEYPNEDEMPNRCGILHARGSPPTVKVIIADFLNLTKLKNRMPNFSGGHFAVHWRTDRNKDGKLPTRETVKGRSFEKRIETHQSFAEGRRHGD